MFTETTDEVTRRSQIMKRLEDLIVRINKLDEEELLDVLAVIAQRVITGDETSLIELCDEEDKPVAYLLSRERFEDSEKAQAILDLDHPNVDDAWKNQKITGTS